MQDQATSLSERSRMKVGMVQVQARQNLCLCNGLCLIVSALSYLFLWFSERTRPQTLYSLFRRSASDRPTDRPTFSVLTSFPNAPGLPSSQANSRSLLYPSL